MEHRTAGDMDAHLTNALTNGLHALFLLLYFLAAVRARQEGNARFTQAVVAFFLLTFVLKVLGVFVHANPTAEGVEELWIAISVGLVLLNSMVLHALRFSLGFRVAAAGFFIVCTYLAIVRHDFVFLAVQILAANLAAAFYCSGLLRIGFAGVVISNAVWILVRKGTEAWLGREVPTGWRYDNDLFHLMLIVSTFIIYKGFARGSGLPESFAREQAAAPAKALD